MPAMDLLPWSMTSRCAMMSRPTTRSCGTCTTGAFWIVTSFPAPSITIRGAREMDFLPLVVVDRYFARRQSLESETPVFNCDHETVIAIATDEHDDTFGTGLRHAGEARIPGCVRRRHAPLRQATAPAPAAPVCCRRSPVGCSALSSAPPCRAPLPSFFQLLQASHPTQIFRRHPWRPGFGSGISGNCSNAFGLVSSISAVVAAFVELERDRRHEPFLIDATEAINHPAPCC